MESFNLFISSLFTLQCVVSIVLSSNTFNYEGECEGYDNAYEIGILYYSNAMGSSVGSDGVTTFLEDPELGPNALQTGTGGDPNGFGLTKRFFCTNNNNDNTKIYLKGYGFPKSVPVTAWFVCPPTQRTHPIFGDEDVNGVGILGEWQVPVQPITAAYTNGRGYDINTLNVNKNDGTFIYSVELDFNPSIKFQTPLPNRRSVVLQNEFPDTIGNEQEGLYTNLKQNLYRDSGRYQEIAREYIRYFNEDGSQMVDEYGRAKIVRSPCAHTTIPLVGHIDKLTHGTDPALFYRFIEEEYNKGDHFPVIRLTLSDLTPINTEETCSYILSNKISLCEYSPCDCEYEMNLGCKEGLCHDNVGCSECIDGYFKKNYNYKCSHCQSVFGNNCLHCTDFIGCQQCDENSERKFSEECQLWYCQ